MTTKQFEALFKHPHDPFIIHGGIEFITEMNKILEDFIKENNVKWNQKKN